MTHMKETAIRARTSHRAQLVSLDFAFTSSSSWPASLVDQVTNLLASALVKDLNEHPIGELPASELLS
jgi:hypothetical protein